MRSDTGRNNPLPASFGDLAPYVGDWALATEEERYFKLLATPITQLRAFYDAVLPRAEEIIAYLSRFPLDGGNGDGSDDDGWPEDARLLYRLLVTFVETAHPIDLGWRQTDIDNGVPPESLRFSGASIAPRRG